MIILLIKNIVISSWCRIYIYIYIVTYFEQSAESGHTFYSDAKSRNFQSITITTGKGLDCSIFYKRFMNSQLESWENSFALVLLLMAQLSFCGTRNILIDFTKLLHSWVQRVFFACFCSPFQLCVYKILWNGTLGPFHELFFVSMHFYRKLI